MRYLVRLKGSNFLLRPGLKEYRDDQLFGFFTTRVVTAATPSEAEAEAIRRINRELKRLRISTLPSNPPLVRVESSETTAATRDAGEGFTWFPQLDE